jgi:hypothetical protein
VLSVGVTHEVGKSGHPAPVHTGDVPRWRVPVLTAAGANRLLHALAGQATAFFAAPTPREQLGVLGGIEHDRAHTTASYPHVQEHDADEVLAEIPEARLGITAASTDAELDELAYNIADSIDHVCVGNRVVVWGLPEGLRELRKRAAEHD